MRRRIPSTQALVCFEATARHQSFTKAGAELSLTQSAVYRQVASLEDFLGVKLFRRVRRGVMLTEAGISYGRQVARRLDAVERDTLAVMSRQGAGGAIDLATVPTFATRWLIPRLAEFRHRHPEITVNLETRTRPFLFADTDFDAALYAGTSEDLARWPGTSAVALLPEVLMPVCSPSLIAPRRRLSPARVADYPLLQQSTRPYAWRAWFDHAGVSGVRDLDGPRFDLFSMLAMAAIHGMGIALVPPMLIEAELARGELIVACNRSLEEERSFYLLTPEGKSGHPPLERFRAWLVQAAGTTGPREHSRARSSLRD